MVPKPVFNSSTQKRLSIMRPDSAKAVMDWCKHPFFEEAAKNGKPLTWWFYVNSDTWIQIQCDETRNTDIAVWTIEGHAVQPTNYEELRSMSIKGPLPSQRQADCSLEVGRSQMAIALMTNVFKHLVHAVNFDNYARHTVEGCIRELSRHVPWFANMATLAKKLHGPQHSPTRLALAMHNQGLFQDLSFIDRLRTMASPCTTAQGLLEMHSSVHKEETPALYELIVENGPITYMFVQNKTDFNDALGVCMWLDDQGSPLFINQKGAHTDSYFTHPYANERALPVPSLLNNVDWMPNELTSNPNHHVEINDWKEALCSGFNAPTRLLCDVLATSMPTRLTQEQSLEVIERWLASTQSLEDTWLNNLSKRNAERSTFNGQCSASISLAAFGQWAATTWATQYPKEYAVLKTLMEPMESPQSIDAWRQRMHEMTREKEAVQYEVGMLVATHEDEPTPHST